MQGVMGYQPVIGLEVHAQLATDTKLFCACATTFGAEANDQTCPVCLGFPGCLPVLNKKAVAFAIRFGLAIGADPRGTSIFARKNYFYPDLPKGYQISQFERPVVGRGSLEIELEDGAVKQIGITRAHLEEDAGQSIHEGYPQSDKKSYINLNRAGTPLLEIVSDPVMHSPEEAYAYLHELKLIVQHLGICDGNMEEGSLRCDANVSIRPHGSNELNTRTEIKNLNSFNNVRRAIQHEIERQVTLTSQGEQVRQCTLLWDVDTQTTRIMRMKEDSEDYRYFPEPDLPPLVIAETEVAAEQQTLPELPRPRFLRYRDAFGLSKPDATLLVSDHALGAFFEETATLSGNPKAAANWIMTELLRELKRDEIAIQDCAVKAPTLATLIKRIDEGAISGKIAKEVFAAMIESGDDPDAIIDARGLAQISDAGALQRIIDQVLAEFPSQVEDYRGGKTKIFGFLVGQAMRLTKGQANPGEVNKLLKKALNNH